MKVSPFAQMSTRRPKIFPGRMYFLACCKCDMEWLGSFLEDVETYLYHASTPAFEDLKLDGWQEKNHTWCFLSVPMGDAQLVFFILCGQKKSFTLQPVKEFSDKNVNNVFRLCESDTMSCWYNIEPAIVYFEQGKYQECADALAPFCRENGFAMRYMLLSWIRMDPFDKRILGGIRRYTDFNPANAYPQLLFAFWAAKVGEHRDYAYKCLGVVHKALEEKLMPEHVRPLTAQIMGEFAMLEKKFDDACVFFEKTYKSYYARVAQAFVDHGMYQHACKFAFMATSYDPTNTNCLLWAKCEYALGRYSWSRFILRQSSLPSDLRKTQKWPKTQQRICEFCACFFFMKEDTVVCQYCEEVFYCSTECLENGMEEHQSARCRFCCCCGEHIPFDTHRLVCSGCNWYFYCSSKCQTNHWYQGHNNDCKKE